MGIASLLAAVVVIVGHGARFELALPAQAGPFPGNDEALGLAHEGPGRVWNVLLLPHAGKSGAVHKVEHEGKPALQLGEGLLALLGVDMKDESAVGRLSAGAEGSWRIESRGLSAPLPNGWAMRAFDDPGADWSYELYPARNGVPSAWMIYARLVEGEAIPTPVEVVGKGKLVASDADIGKARSWLETLTKAPHWVETAIELGGKPWRVRNYWKQLSDRSMALVVAQAPEADSRQAFATADAFVAGVNVR